MNTLEAAVTQDVTTYAGHGLVPSDDLWTGAPAPEDDDYSTGDATLDDPLNHGDIGDAELLTVSFGTSFNENRRLTIGAIEHDIIGAFPEYAVRRAFTSQIIINHVARRDGIRIDNLAAAFDRAAQNNVQTLVVQPTHLMDGNEYHDVVHALEANKHRFVRTVLGKPVLDSEEDFRVIAESIVEASRSYEDGRTAIVYMGHGTDADSNRVYERLQALLDSSGHENHLVGTVEATPTLDDMVRAVEAGDYERVVLRPLMIVAGDHANNDMAGSEEGTWQHAFESRGYQVECVLEGLGQIPAIRQLLVQHAQDAIEQINR